MSRNHPLASDAILLEQLDAAKERCEYGLQLQQQVRDLQAMLDWGVLDAESARHMVDELWLDIEAHRACRRGP